MSTDIYDPKIIEDKWIRKWEEKGVYRTGKDESKKKAYVLGMFPYPSGEGLHTGHVRIFTAVDVIGRYLRMKGRNVLQPMGWDAFGLPAENAAIKAKTNPMKMVPQNEANFKKQLQLMGEGYDWEREFSTTDPDYYKWTQWLFLKLYAMKNAKGERLIYRKEVPINWCPFCKTGLANEEVLSDGTHERCGTRVEQRDMPQWVMRITDYADRLLMDLDEAKWKDEEGKDRVGLDWPKGILEMQKNWIGKKEGVKVKFVLADTKSLKGVLEIFTTRIDTIFGVSFVAISPEKARELAQMGYNVSEVVARYIESSLAKSSQQRMEGVGEKTGVDTGLKAVNPVNGEKVAVYVADYVLGGVGTGAVMGVPAHDERDFEFAKKFNLPIRPVVVPEREYVDENAKGYYQKRSRLHKDLLKSLARDAVEAGKKVAVAGGWAVFLQTNSEFRDFEDIDLVIFEGDLEWWRKELQSRGLELVNMFPEGKNSKYYFQGVKQDIHVDVVVIKVNEKGKVVWLDSKTPKESDVFEKMFQEKSLDGASVYAMTVSLLHYLKSKKEIRWKEKADFLFMGVKPYEGDGRLLNSGEFDGLEAWGEGKKKMAEWLVEKGYGEWKTNYHLRDWIFSRQRYWGEPFPLVYCDKCGDENGVVTVPEDHLPVKLPELDSYEPSGTGESPLAAAKDWVKTKCPNCGGSARRETDTMPNWAGSCWYFLYFAVRSKELLVGSSKFVEMSEEWKKTVKPALEKWLPVDWYLGGAEHAVLHLLYARFWVKAFYDLGLLKFNEPFLRLRSVGMVLASDGKKMSKSLGNVVNPNDVVARYGADAVRLYEMFMGPWGQVIAWDTRSLVGCYRFAEKVWKLCNRPVAEGSDPQLAAKLNKLVAKIGKDIEELKFNTAVAALMEFSNVWSNSKDGLTDEELKKFLLVLAPFMPYVAEEIWQKLGGGGEFKSIHLESWPHTAEHETSPGERVKVVVQVDGKMRAVLEMKAAVSVIEEEVVEAAKGDLRVKKWLKGDEKIVFVPGRVVNFISR